MLINNFSNYTPIRPKLCTPSFKADASELNDLWEDNPATDGLWKNLSDNYGYSSPAFVLPTSVKVHKTWDEVNGFKNLKNVNSLNKIYTGYTLVKTPEKLKELHDTYGVNTVVDLVGYNEYKDECEKAGLNYFGDLTLGYNLYKRAPFMSQQKFCELYKNLLSKEEQIEAHREATLKFAKTLDKLIEILDGGNVYMGCDHGHSRTNDVILLVNNYRNNKALMLHEEDINDIDWKKDAIKQFKENVKLYSED